jgi:hypothetical protein
MFRYAVWNQFIQDELMIGAFLDSISFIIIILPLTIACIAMYLGAGIHWSIILKDLGVPMGILMCNTGFVGIVQNVDDPYVIGPATAIMLLALFYGGILASIGYFCEFRSESASSSHSNLIEIKWWAPSISIMTFLITLGWFMDEAAGLGAFFYALPFGVCAVTAFTALLNSNRQNVHRALSQSFLLSAMINVLIGVIYFYQGEFGDGVAIGSLGITYSLSAYISLYFLSFKLGDPKKLDPPLMNWHWLEISGFLIFMFLAPVSLPELLSNTEGDEKEEKLELRIQELERKLDLLSQQTTQ